MMLSVIKDIAVLVSAILNIIKVIVDLKRNNEK